jgi:drug/metabolite transporter (DMT)-like permease
MRTNRPASHFVRGLVGVVSMGFSFVGLTLLPLTDAITINYAQPLFVIVFSALFFGEPVRAFRWTAVLAGMIGVVIIAWPKLSVLTGGAEAGRSEAVGVIFMLTAAMMAAVTMLLVRRLVETERTATIVLWFSVTASVFSLATIPFGWISLDMEQALLLIGAGFFGGVAQLFMTQAYRHASMSTIAPFDYSSMLIGIAAGYFFFSDIPTVETLVGGAIVVAAGVLIIWREHQLGLERRRARRVMTPQG